MIKTHGSELCSQEANKHMAQKMQAATTVSYLHVGMVLQFSTRSYIGFALFSTIPNGF